MTIQELDVKLEDLFQECKTSNDKEVLVAAMTLTTLRGAILGGSTERFAKVITEFCKEEVSKLTN